MAEFNPRSIQECIDNKATQFASIRELIEQNMENKKEDNSTSNTAFNNVYANYKKLFDLVFKAHPTITLPAHTLVFHSNQYLARHLNYFEPLNSNMKIQDIRTYRNKQATIPLPFTTIYPRVYCNLTPAGNQYVGANMNVGEGVYSSKEAVHFIQFPYITYRKSDGSEGRDHLKDLINITSTQFFKQYMEKKNAEALLDPTKPHYCGFILSTEVDATRNIDTNATRFAATFDADYRIYPELLIMDGFDKFTKVAQYDLYRIDPTVTLIGTGPAERRLEYRPTMSSIDFITQIVDFVEDNIEDEFAIRRLAFEVQKEALGSIGAKMTELAGNYGADAGKLFAYVCPSAPDHKRFSLPRDIPNELLFDQPA